MVRTLKEAQSHPHPASACPHQRDIALVIPRWGEDSPKAAGMNARTELDASGRTAGPPAPFDRLKRGV